MGSYWRRDKLPRGLEITSAIVNEDLWHPPLAYPGRHPRAANSTGVPGLVRPIIRSGEIFVGEAAICAAVNDLTDGELSEIDHGARRLPLASPADEKWLRRIPLLVAEVRRRRAHKCERGGHCAECGAHTTTMRLCSRCS